MVDKHSKSHSLSLGKLVTRTVSRDKTTSPGSAKWPWSRSSPTVAASPTPNARGSSRTFHDALEKGSGSRVAPADGVVVVDKHQDIRKPPVSPKITTRSLHTDAANTEARSSSEAFIAMSDVVVTITPDCSGSTQGYVLDEEKAIIHKIADLLSHEAQSRMLVLPWNDETDTALSLYETGEMFSSGGTDPTALLRDRHYRKALRHCSLWVLITDGEIKEDLVQDFSTDLGEAGMHGTASIVIVVGRLWSRPIGCNISVGKAVFATVPDGLFLFHDWVGHKVFVLQCKGRFRMLMPDPNCSIVLDDNTTWDDLPKMNYEDLRGFGVPQKRDLHVDVVILTSGNRFNLNDVYNDTLDDATTNEILSNDDDLKTLLMTASTRGRRADVKRWISKKQLTASDPLWAPRNDIDHRALRCTETLVEALRSQTQEGVAELKSELRTAHERNWTAFATSIMNETQDAEVRSNVIKDATARLVYDCSAPSTPGLLGAVSPAISRAYFQPSEVSVHDFADDMQPGKQAHGSRRKPRGDKLHPGVLFTQGYKHLTSLNQGAATLSAQFEGVCPLCARSGQVMALILQAPEEPEPTPNFPLPEQHAKHVFPFVLGNYPEVDIISHDICCEACSVYLKCHGQSPKAERVVGALPLVQTHGNDHGPNLQSWTDALSNIFDGRFHADIVASVFLAVLYNTLDDLTSVDSSENTYLIRAVRWACRNLLKSILVSRDTATVPLGQSTTPGTRSSAPLAETIPWLVKDALNWNGTFLDYPLAGFLVLVLAARDIDNEICERGSLRCVVWLRLLMHLNEEHWVAVATTGHENARASLASIIAEDKEDDAASAAGASPISLTSLKGTYLVSTTDWQTLERLGSFSKHIQTKCGWALTVFLHCLLAYAPRCRDKGECRGMLRKEAKLKQMFNAPELLDQGRARRILNDLSPPPQALI